MRTFRPRALPALLSTAVLALAGCGPSISVPELTADDLPRLERAGNFPHVVYRIEPGNALQIRYPFHPEMDQPEVTVEPDGRIMATRVGAVTVAGLTTTELEQLLRERTSDRLKDPEVVVSVRRFSEKPVYVGGEVGKPGSLPYRKGLTPLQAVIAAGGFKDTARLDSVILVRASADNQFITRKIDLAQPIHDGVKEPLLLAPHDIVFVPRTPIANADLWVRQHVSELLPFLRLSTPTGF